MDRREFLGAAGAAIAGAPMALGQARGGAVALVVDPADPVASSPPAQWAAQELQRALIGSGFTVNRRQRIEQAAPGELCIVASSSAAPVAMAAVKSARLNPLSGSESLALFETRTSGRPCLFAWGTDARGLVYALLDLADRVKLAPPGSAPQIEKPVVEGPANRVRSVMRQFTSEPLDKPWFYDREMWPEYLTMLAKQRFNRFHLAFGFGYDALQQVADSYLLFLYPFLLSVPAYNVRATNLSDAERDRNLETLRFISEQTVARGIDFQLGVWMHGYRLTNSPRGRNIIEGLTDDNHAPYCRDALTAILKACPAISSVALRIHGESGIAEGSYEFWSTVFDGVKRCGRKVEIDLHAKGIDATMIDRALATGMPVNLAPKFSAEHLGMPYHQAAIRDLEMPVEGRTGRGLMTISEGARVFTRYGYADLLRGDRKYTVRHRVFSGTQRILLSNDPEGAAAYARAFQFCGSTGADLMEPLTCRGRRGTGLPGSRRSGYLDANAEPRWDWQKYETWYRTWGRAMYSPQSQPAHPAPGESALARASRILPIVTTAHLPSAACDAYWPEIYWNQPMVAEARSNPYGDSPTPRTFQNVSPLDPQLFSRMSDFADELLKGERSGKYSPIEVAQWLEDLAARTEEDPLDVRIQMGLGRFFAAKFRSGVLYSIHERTGDRAALEAALKMYRTARKAWAEIADRTKLVYAADLSVSDKLSERGQWADRLPAIDQDIAAMEQRLPPAKSSADPRVSAAVAEALARPRREPTAVSHQPPPFYRLKEALALELAIQKGRTVASVRLFYRHVNQAERFVMADMQPRGKAYRAEIPAAYADTRYPLQYYFELRESPEKVWLYPGFAENRLNQPYFVVEPRARP